LPPLTRCHHTFVHLYQSCLVCVCVLLCLFSPSVLVAAEAVNALCDGMGDDSCVEVRRQLQMADALVRLQPALEARGRNLKGLTLTEDQVERVEDVLGNLAGFIAHIRRR
jgi:hypothetical protein